MTERALVVQIYYRDERDDVFQMLILITSQVVCFLRSYHICTVCVITCNNFVNEKLLCLNCHCSKTALIAKEAPLDFQTLCGSNKDSCSQFRL